MKIPSIISVKTSTPNRIYQYLAALTGTLGIVASQMHYGWPSPSLPILKNGTYRIQVDETEGSWLAIMPPIGAIFGAITTCLVIDILGRKKVILLSSIPFFVSWIIIGLAETSVFLHVARFVGGFCDGLSFTAVPMYLGEIADPKIRGLLGSMFSISIVVGLLSINIMGSYLDIPTTAFISSVVPATLLLTFMWMPESPYFLLMREKHEDATKNLQMLRGTENIDRELERLTNAVKEQNENTGKFLDLFSTPSNRKAVFITLGLRSVQQLTGIMAITIFCHQVFEESEEFLPPAVSTMVYFGVELLLSASSSFLVDVAGRRPLLFASLTGTTTTLFISGTYLYIKNCTEIDTSSFDFLLLVTLIVFIVMFNVGLQTIPILIMSELFPTNVKAAALCIADIYFGIIASVVSKFFLGTSSAFGMHVPFYSFVVCGILGMVFVYFFVPETKGRTLEDIQKYLKGDIKL